MIAFITCSMIITLTPLSRIAAHKVHRPLDLNEVQARHHLVEQQHFRLHRQRLRHFQPLAVGERKLVGRASARASRPMKASTSSAFAAAARDARPVAFAKERADHDILPHRHALKGLDDLPCPRDAHPADVDTCASCQHARYAPEDAARPLRVQVLAMKEDAARGRRINAGDRVNERGLARAIRPDQPEDFPPMERERGIRAAP